MCCHSLLLLAYCINNLEIPIHFIRWDLNRWLIRRHVLCNFGGQGDKLPHENSFKIGSTLQTSWDEVKLDC